MQEDFYHFAAVSKGLGIREKLKLILFASGEKPNTYVVLKINPDSLQEKFELEQVLKKNNVVYKVSKEKSYEEIDKIIHDEIRWELKGTWFGFDLFKDHASLDRFKKYVDFLKDNNPKEADKVAGEVYGYPKCCVKQFIKERNENFIKNNFSCYEYYKRKYETDRKFPWVFHEPCSADCKETEKINGKYEEAVKKAKKKIWQEYKKKRVYEGDFIVVGESDVTKKNKSVWDEKDGHEYELVTKSPFEGRHYLVSFLTKEDLPLGQVFFGKAIFKYDYADVSIKKVKKRIGNIHHVRNLPLTGRKF